MPTDRSTTPPASSLRTPEDAALAEFLLPIARVCESGETFNQHWGPGGPWTTGS